MGFRLFLGSPHVECHVFPRGSQEFRYYTGRDGGGVLIFEQSPEPGKSRIVAMLTPELLLEFLAAYMGVKG